MFNYVPTLLPSQFVITSPSNGTERTGSVSISGTIMRVDIIPGAGADQPTDQFDLTIKDAQGIDILMGGGANCSNATAKTFAPMINDQSGSPAMNITTCGVHTISLTNAGNSKKITINVHQKV